MVSVLEGHDYVQGLSFVHLGIKGFQDRRGQV